MTHGDQPGRGTGPVRNPGDSSSPPELSLAVLECDEREAQAHLAALEALVQSAAGTVCVTEVTSTCLAIEIDAPPVVLARLKGALKLAGATIMTGVASGEHPLCVILTMRSAPNADPLT